MRLRCCVSCFALGSWFKIAFGFGGRRCDGGCVGGVVEEEVVVCNICIGDGVGERQEGGGFDGTRGLGGSVGKVSATE